MSEMSNVSTNANLDINTAQPKVLRGLKLRGVKTHELITCKTKNNAGEDRYIKIREEDYDKELHGEKVDKIPSRKKAKKKAAKAKDGDGE